MTPHQLDGRRGREVFEVRIVLLIDVESAAGLNLAIVGRDHADATGIDRRVDAMRLSRADVRQARQHARQPLNHGPAVEVVELAERPRLDTQAQRRRPSTIRTVRQDHDRSEYETQSRRSPAPDIEHHDRRRGRHRSRAVASVRHEPRSSVQSRVIGTLG